MHPPWLRLCWSLQDGPQTGRPWRTGWGERPPWVLAMAGGRSWGAEEEDAKYHKQIKERKSSYSGFTAEGFET